MDEAYLRDKLDRIAEDGAVTRTKVEAIERRMKKGEGHFEAFDRRISSLESWRNRILGGLALMLGLGAVGAKAAWDWIKGGGGG